MDQAYQHHRHAQGKIFRGHGEPIKFAGSTCSKGHQGAHRTGLATPSPEIYKYIKHPQTAPPTLSSEQVPAPATLNEATVLKGVKSFPKGSAPGPSGWRPTVIFEKLWVVLPPIAPTGSSPPCSSRCSRALAALVWG